MHSIRYQISLLVLALLIGTGAFAQDDAIGKFFGRYIDDSRFSVVSISPRMFKLIAGLKWDSADADVKKAAQNVTSLRILSTETTPRLFYKEALERIDRSQYEELITVRDKGDDTRFMIRESGGTIHELLMISVDSTDFSLMSFMGNIDLSSISQLSSDLSLHGMEKLKDAKLKH